jgi:hypothetical protein
VIGVKEATLKIFKRGGFQVQEKLNIKNIDNIAKLGINVGDVLRIKDKGEYRVKYVTTISNPVYFFLEVFPID